MECINILSHEESPELINLPGSWPGIINDKINVVRELDDSEFFITALKKSAGRIKNVMLIGTNHYACSGVRYCIQQVDNIRLKQYYDFSMIYSRAEEYRADAIILMPENESEEQSVFISVMLLQHYLPSTKTIIVGERMGRLSKLLRTRSCCFLNDKTTSEEFYHVIEFMLADTACKARCLSEILTPQQWRTLCLLSDGLTLSDTAREMGVSPKTAYTHKIRALTRMGIDSRTHEAWIMEAFKRLIHGKPY
ncbi:helix-turn-helix transcriptional regulator [Enterobacter bugandensis]|uniref:helix-turn-helix transcriptional regulator n=1 Tax=Enterobacter bugandensis TaxID=881260 RepID=UPI0022E31F94|nr:LuxR C-terminal-related transcriptional regulator [Enterobacter bugandensis]